MDLISCKVSEIAMSDKYRLRRNLPVGFELQPGFHGAPEEGMCALETVAWMAGLPHSDQPPCVCPVIATLLRSMNAKLRSVYRFVNPLRSTGASITFSFSIKGSGGQDPSFFLSAVMSSL